jgi:hypothetical protein
MRRIALCLFAVAGFGVACGGDSTPPLSADEFVRQSNAICQAGDAALIDAGKEILTATVAPQALVRFYREHTVPKLRSELKEIKKLKAPEDERDKVEKMLAAGKRATDAVAKGLKDQGPTYLATKGTDPFKEFDETAAELRLTSCVTKVSGQKPGAPESSLS